MSKTSTSTHPNVALLERLAKSFPHDLEKLSDLIAEDFVLHYFNSRIPDLDGDYKGLNGLKSFFQKVGTMSEGSFRVTDTQIIHIGDELVVTTAKPVMTTNGNSFEMDSLFIWRIAENRFVEAWDIPAVNTTRKLA